MFLHTKKDEFEKITPKKLLIVLDKIHYVNYLSFKINKDENKWTSSDESFFDMSYKCETEWQLRCYVNGGGPSKFSHIFLQIKSFRGFFKIKMLKYQGY